MNSLFIFLPISLPPLSFSSQSIFSSFDEHALIDLPYMIDKALSVSRQSNLYYIGHSQGTTMGFAGFTHNKTLASRIKTFFALAPVAYSKYATGLLRLIADHYHLIEVGTLIFYVT